MKQALEYGEKSEKLTKALFYGMYNVHGTLNVQNANMQQLQNRNYEDSENKWGGTT